MEITELQGIKSTEHANVESKAGGDFDLVDLRVLKNRIDWNLQYGDISPSHHFSLLMVSVDNLWVYADCLGTHVAGRLLMAVAQTIVQALDARSIHEANLAATPSVGARAMVSHIGGDVLAVLLEGRDPSESGAKAARQVIQALYRLNTEPDLDTFATTTLGVVDVQGGHQIQGGAAQVLRDAQVAMHHARSLGRGSSCVFQPDLRRSAAGRLKLECDLRKAVNANAFSLAYQPIVELESGMLTGFEALLRWQRPDGTWVSPADFIPLAEETGLIWPIGQFVLDEACRQLAIWRRNHNITMNVNVSRRQFADEGLMDLVATIINRHGIPPDALALEITESTLLGDSVAVMRMMNCLTEAGLALYLDDFGTGYSSLGSLHQFPVKGLKVDRSFIARASGRRDYAAVLHAIVMLADNLGLDVVGEGMETREQVALLQSLNCPKGQGYFFGKPLPVSEAEAILAAGLPALR